MTDNLWTTIKYFKKEDNWGDPQKMSYDLIKKLDALRAFLNQPIIVNCGTQGAHVENSYHYSGLAADVSFPQAKNIMDIFFAATRFNFGGIGIYPQWHTPGLHLDVRYNPNNHSALWLARLNEKNVQEYVDLNVDNLKPLNLF